MFDENEYREAFSHVTASQATRMEVLKMKTKEKRTGAVSIRRAAVIASAVIVLMAFTVTVFASEEFTSWVQSYFTAYSGKLSDKQQGYLSEHEQQIFESQTVNGWTVQLKSAIHDGTIGYMVFDLIGPEGEDVGHYTFGNTGRAGYCTKAPDILQLPEGLSRYCSWGYSWLEDGDGRSHTKRLVVNVDPNEDDSSIDAFGPNAIYRIHMENIVQEFQCDEDASSRSWEVISEGQWDFDVIFTEGSREAVELLEDPITVNAWFLDHSAGKLVNAQGTALLYSVEMRNLTVTIRYAASRGAPIFERYEDDECIRPAVVMKDGGRVELMSRGGSDSGCQTLSAMAPIILEEVDHILLADGTVIPVPEGTK